MISCEIPLLLSISGVVMLAGSFRMADIVHVQDSMWFVVLQPVAFVVYFVAMISEIERIPFDLPEAEAELVEGWQTEYSGMKFAFAMMAGYIRGYIGCAIGVILFFGGWSSPVPAYTVPLPWGGEFSGPVPELWFLVKVLLLFMFLVWLRAALGRADLVLSEALEDEPFAEVALRGPRKPGCELRRDLALGAVGRDDEEPAAARIAGLVHDAGKELPKARMVAIAQTIHFPLDEPGNSDPLYLHGPCSTYLAQHEMGMT
jgi:hypothetical protein